MAYTTINESAEKLASLWWAVLFRSPLAHNYMPVGPAITPTSKTYLHSRSDKIPTDSLRLAANKNCMSNLSSIRANLPTSNRMAVIDNSVRLWEYQAGYWLARKGDTAYHLWHVPLVVDRSPSGLSCMREVPLLSEHLLTTSKQWHVT